jgi:hypothetical protein
MIFLALYFFRLLLPLCAGKQVDLLFIKTHDTENKQGRRFSKSSLSSVYLQENGSLNAADTIDA